MKVYCNDCKYLKEFIIPIAYMAFDYVFKCTYPNTPYDVDTPLCVVEKRRRKIKSYMQQNANNDCCYYKRKWWKFWLRRKL